MTFTTRDNFAVWEDSCKLHNQWGVYANFNGDMVCPEDDVVFNHGKLEIEEYCLHKGWPKASFYILMDSLSWGNLVLFNSEQEADEVYQLFNDSVMDSSCWFACLISPADGVVTENT